MEFRSKIQRVAGLNTELNLVPIIDCFVILLCFLLLTFSITQLVHLQGSIMGNTLKAMQKSRNELKEFHLKVVLESNGHKIHLNGEKVKDQTWTEYIPKLDNGSYNFQALHLKLIELKSQYPERFSIDIAIDAKEEKNIKYDFVLATMDSVRHLTNKEFSNMTAARKKIQGYPLLKNEKKLQPEPHLVELAKGISSNKLALQTDTKLLFPDIALVGVQ